MKKPSDSNSPALLCDPLRDIPNQSLIPSAIGNRQSSNRQSKILWSPFLLMKKPSNSNRPSLLCTSLHAIPEDKPRSAIRDPRSEILWSPFSLKEEIDSNRSTQFRLLPPKSRLRAARSHKPQATSHKPQATNLCIPFSLMTQPSASYSPCDTFRRRARCPEPKAESREPSAAASAKRLNSRSFQSPVYPSPKLIARSTPARMEKG